MKSLPLAIVTDSTCDIPQELIEKYQITVIPHTIIWGNEEYRDRVDLTPEEFYRRLEEGEKLIPTTSQASISDYQNLFEKLKEQGAREIVTFTVSSAMSGAFQSATNAAALVDIPVHIVDSKGPTMTLGWQVLAAARARDNGADWQAIEKLAAKIRKTMVQIVGMDTIEFLYHGGRIGLAKRLIGSALQIKPVVSINHETGLVEPDGSARTYRNMIEMVYRRFGEKIRKDGKLHIAVMHGAALEEAERLAERLRKDFDPVELLINLTGPVLGINTGPRAVAICGYSEEE
ncbi:MAG: DegV family protein [Anaerolineaceae bacterium]